MCAASGFGGALSVLAGVARNAMARPEAGLSQADFGEPAEQGLARRPAEGPMPFDFPAPRRLPHQ
jgi:hypothetical protein